MISSSQRRPLVFVVTLVALVAMVVPARADHSWGSYHWARKSNPFTLKLGDNVDSRWDSYLATTSTDWSKSSVLDTVIVPGGTSPKSCRPTSGQVEVCNASYGNTGWLGVAQIWTSGSHITKATAKMNDTYFDTAKYNTPAWRNLVMCQEVGHDFGLDHQDEAFDNPNLGTCMDYTSDPDGPPSNEHPNSHDYEQLETIYGHLDSTTTVSASAAKGSNADLNSPAEWGKVIRTDADGRPSLYVRDFGGGQKVFTFVYWAR